MAGYVAFESSALAEPIAQSRKASPYTIGLNIGRLRVRMGVRRIENSFRYSAVFMNGVRVYIGPGAGQDATRGGSRLFCLPIGALLPFMSSASNSEAIRISRCAGNRRVAFEAGLRHSRLLTNAIARVERRRARPVELASPQRRLTCHTTSTPLSFPFPEPT
jgi:hypothetical protein